MRRKDREITDTNEIIKIVSECDVLHLGRSLRGPNERLIT